MKKIFYPLLVLECFLAVQGCSPRVKSVPLPLDKWTCLTVDSTRAKWGDFDPPAWLKYFGLSGMDITGDGFKEIVSGRYFYRNPAKDMTGTWTRTDFGFNIDGYMFTDVDGDVYGDIIAEALPSVYWLEAQDQQGRSWKASKVCELSKTQHINGQGYFQAQIIPGGKPEILLSTGQGIHFLSIPQNPEAGNWPKVRAAKEASEEGIGVADMDEDGWLDIAAGSGEKGEAMAVSWWKNPGNGSSDWIKYDIGNTVLFCDRVAVADLNGDKRPDIVVTEERYPEVEGASVYWFENPPDPKSPAWPRRTIVTQNTSNNLDLADMDRDGDIDIITAEHRGSKKLEIWENINNAGQWQEHVVSIGKENHLGARVFDMDHDGDLDIIGIAWDDYPYLYLWRNDAIQKNDSFFLQNP